MMTAGRRSPGCRPSGTWTTPASRCPSDIKAASCCMDLQPSLSPRHPSHILRANLAKQQPRGNVPMTLITRAFAVSLLRGAIAASVAIGVAAASSSSAPAQQKIALRVAYIPVITWLPVLIAKDEGFFDANGLDVTFTKFPNIVN